MIIAIIGGGWSGIHFSYMLNKLNNNNTILLFEKNKIGGKCPSFPYNYPGGAVIFPFFNKYFGKILDEFGINLNKKFYYKNMFPHFKNPIKSKNIIEKYQGINNLFNLGSYLSFENL